ncbi:RNA-binding cell elongation regulator Jag/EloR [Desulfuribacillus alkaliarsenatis]|uniref:RNA-binding protein KhpB n=1 Tax=Desulfuribacillus alkaliarsenatis TaxID=766136 RepID=A0A1E5G2M1_9FIRM|nr:RNA-binding cell elongation regulator Jag/EloR [Desulfuribacillus alkaliarsenatis]OEF97316.1 DNA-binding protein [Desulfuribacillus alkaliarsenatis]
MKKIVEVAKSIDEAIQAGLAKLGVTKDDVEINVLVEPTKGFLGFGAKDAEVELIVKNNPVIEGKKFLTDVFNAMDLQVEIEEYELDNQKVLNLVGDNLGVLIGRRGQTLDALQYLVNISANRDTDNNVRFLLDAENYRDRRKKTLESLADRLADKARKSKKDVVLEPMSPYERKVIHTHLQNEQGIFTRSQGQEPYRKIVIGTKKTNGSRK